MISSFFASWLSKQKEPSILSNQVNAVGAVLDRMENADLISVMFNGDEWISLKALKILKARFEDELNFLNQYPQAEEDNACRDWD